MNQYNKEKHLYNLFLLFKQPSCKTYYINSFAINPNPSVPSMILSGAQIKSLYNVPTVVASSTRKVKIAIVIAYRYPIATLQSDLKMYWQSYSNFGPTSNPPTVNVYTMPGATINADWNMEEALDIQMVCTMNPNSTIWVIEAKSSSITDLLNAVTYASQTIKADVISMSWGTNDSSLLGSYNSIFSNTSQCYCVSSGDTNNASWPATSSNVLAVGGTTLLWNPSSSNLRTEFTWTGTGSGYSSSSLQPTYQSNISSISHTADVGRVIPDLSLTANPNNGVYIVYNGKWYALGGTSVSCPIFAGILSLANQLRFNANKVALTTVFNSTITNNLQNYLYKTIYPNVTKYRNCFNDITIGSHNGSSTTSNSSLTINNALTGYDITTGIGSPNCANLCNELLNI